MDKIIFHGRELNVPKIKFKRGLIRAKASCAEAFGFSGGFINKVCIKADCRNCVFGRRNRKLLCRLVEKAVKDRVPEQRYEAAFGPADGKNPNRAAIREFLNRTADNVQRERMQELKVSDDVIEKLKGIQEKDTELLRDQKLDHKPENIGNTEINPDGENAIKRDRRSGDRRRADKDEGPAIGKPVANYGWICPVCGRGNSPYTSTCSCQQWNQGVTCTSGGWA